MINILKKLLLLFFAFTVVTRSIATPPKNKQPEQKKKEPTDEEKKEDVLKVFFEILKKTKNDDFRKREQAAMDENINNTNLHNATLRQNLEEIKTLLEQNPQDLKSQNKSGNTPLHIALALGASEQDGRLEEKQQIINEIINLLIEKIKQQENAGTILNTQNIFGITPLHMAAGTNKIEAIKAFLNTNKINTELADEAEYTALLIAAKLGFTEIVKLLATEENIYSTNDEGNTALHLAAKSKNFETVLAILRKESEIENRTKNSLFIKNNLGLIPAQCSDLHADSHKTLVTINKQIFEVLVKSLKTKSTDKFIETMELIIKTNNITDVIELHNLNTILHLATHTGHLEKTRAILEKFTININVRNGSNDTPLHGTMLSDKENTLDIVKLLVKNGADINAINSKGNNSLHLAVMNKKNEVIDFLLTQENVDINHIDNNSLRPLHLAIMNNNIAIINKLIKHNAIIDPGMFETAKQYPTIIKILKKAQKQQTTQKTKTITELNEEERKKNAESLIADLEADKKKTTQKPKKKKKKKGKKDKSKGKSKEKPKEKPEKDLSKKLKEKAEQKEINKKLEEQAIRKRDLRIQQEQKLLEEKKKAQKEKEESDAKEREKNARLEQIKKESAIKIQRAFRNYKKRKHIYNAIYFIHEKNCAKKFNELLLAQQFMTGQTYDKKFENLNYIAKDFKDNNGNTALHLFAQSNDHSKYIPVLLNYGSDINSQNNDGMTPLHIAVFHGNESAVELLIENGANVNTHEKHLGFTPLHEAVNQKKIRIVRMLVASKADVNALDKSTKSPFSYSQAHAFTAALCGQGIYNNNVTPNKNLIIDVSDEDDSKKDLAHLQRERLTAQKEKYQLIEDSFERLELKQLLKDFEIKKQDLQN